MVEENIKVNVSEKVLVSVRITKTTWERAKEILSPGCLKRGDSADNSDLLKYAIHHATLYDLQYKPLKERYNRLKEEKDPDHVPQMRKQLKEAHDAVETIKGTLLKKETFLAEKIGLLQEKMGEINRLKTVNNTLTEQITTLTNVYNDLEAVYKDLVSVNSTLTTVNKDRESVNKRLEHDCKQLSGDIQQYERNQKSLERGITDLRNAIIRIRRSYEDGGKPSPPYCISCGRKVPQQDPRYTIDDTGEIYHKDCYQEKQGA